MKSYATFATFLLAYSPSFGWLRLVYGVCVCGGGGCTGECVQNYNSCSVARNVVMSFVTAVNLCPGIPDRCDTLGRSDSQCLSHDLFSIR